MVSVPDLRAALHKAVEGQADSEAYVAVIEKLIEGYKERTSYGPNGEIYKEYYQGTLVRP